jgi:hypothetical protein
MVEGGNSKKESPEFLIVLRGNDTKAMNSVVGQFDLSQSNNGCKETKFIF